MSSSRETANVAAIAAQIASTQTLIQTLLHEIRSSTAAQAALKQDLKSLRHSVGVLSNLVRGDDGHSRPLLSEVELLKHADQHFEKRLTALMKDLDEQVTELTRSFANQIAELKGGMEKAEENRRQDETARVALQVEERKDIRLDKRQRFATWTTVIIAIISLAGSIAALALGSGK
jgi:chromosome segregation ATPase